MDQHYIELNQVGHLFIDFFERTAVKPPVPEYSQQLSNHKPGSWLVPCLLQYTNQQHIPYSISIFSQNKWLHLLVLPLRMICSLLLHLLNRILFRLAVRSYLNMDFFISIVLNSHKSSYFLFQFLSCSGLLTASSLLLASSGFQCPFPSFCFCNWSCLCLSLCSAVSGLSTRGDISSLLE